MPRQLHEWALLLAIVLLLFGPATIHAQSDITQPDDLIVGTSANTPISGVVANAINNQDSEYLNFDKLNAGFTVTPSVGATIVTGLTLKSASAAPERDPASYILSGSNDGSQFTEIGRGSVPTFSGRLVAQTFHFSNATAYKIYRLIFPTVANPETANSMHIAEVELLGVVAPQDVTRPGDVVVATSSNSPASAGADHAIDDTATPYQNFDKLNSGFTVTPSVGRTIVTALSLTSAADAPERDPASFILYGSDDGTVFFEIASGPVPAFSGRSVVQRISFTNSVELQSYKLVFPTVADAAAADSMQIGEVEFLGFVAGSGAIPKFKTQPVDASILLGSTAQFRVTVNGPWEVQWYRNNSAIPGATGLTYQTPPVTVENENDAYYAVARNGVVVTSSDTARVHIFTPSTIKSISVNFGGAGLSGAPSTLDPTDIAGVWPQAFWNNALGDSGNLTGETLRDSDNSASAVFIDWQTSGSWDSAVGSETPDERMLNGMLYPQNGSVAVVSFSNLQPRKYRIIAYTLNRAGAFDNANYTVAGETTSTIHIRAQNADEYQATPQFLRAAENAVVRQVGNYIQFPNISPSPDGTITFTAESLPESPGAAASAAPVNGVQIIYLPTAPRLSAQALGKQIRLEWDQPGFVLERSDSATGPYAPVTGVSGTVFITSSAAGKSFFRLTFP